MLISSKILVNVFVLSLALITLYVVNATTEELPFYTNTINNQNHIKVEPSGNDLASFGNYIPKLSYRLKRLLNSSNCSF